ncbi:MAG TPA: transposase [Candidatus Angelobacter sp.]|nr:transposase [Candidatus Angelobacter sp.]
MLAVKSVKQRYQPSGEILRLLETFRCMVNETLQTGLSYGACSLKRLSCLSYRRLRRYDSPSCYKLCAISRAAGILSARKKSLRRGIRTRDPYSLKPVLTAYQGFKVQDGELRIPVGQRRFQVIRLTNHTASVLSDKSLRVRSFTLTGSFLSLCISKEVREVGCTGTVGVDRNLRNLTVGNEYRTVQYDLSKSVRIAETTAEIVGSFKRNDVRVRRVIASKYGQRRRERTLRLLHNVTRQIVTRALREKQAIVLENIEGIRRLYRRGNGQGSMYRRRMNGWRFSEAQRQLEYKARWVGLPVIRLSRRETRGTSVTCPQCGERLQEDKRLWRKLWCRKCRVMMDRDVVASLNLSRRGRLRFDRSRVRTGPEGGAVEAVKGNPTTTVIPGVDAPKSGISVQQPKT